MSNNEVTLWAEPGEQEQRLRALLERSGLKVGVVFASGEPVLESRLLTVRGEQKIRAYFGTKPSPSPAC